MRLFCKLLIFLYFCGCDNQTTSTIETDCGVPSFLMVTDLERTSNNIIFAATSNGILISEDSGSTWCPANFNSSGIISIQIDSRDVVFVATEDSGVWMSRNLGQDWDNISSTSSIGEISAMVINDQDQLLVGTLYGDLYISIPTNNAFEWYLSERFVGWIEVIAFGGDNFYVATDWDFYRTTNLGASWEVLGNHFETTKAIVVINKDTLVAANEFGLTVSTDGADWDHPRTNWGFGLYVMRADNGALYGSVNRYGSNIFFKSTNSGITWDSLATFNSEVRTILEDRHGDLIVGTRNGIFKSVDRGCSWH